MGNECVMSSTDVCSITLSTCGFFSSIGQSMFASGEVAHTPSRYTVLPSCLSTDSCTVMCSVTVDFAQPTCPKSLIIAIDRLRSPPSSVALRRALAIRNSPPPPGCFQCTSDPGHPDQVPWTLRRLHDSYLSHHRRIYPPPGVLLVRSS